MQKLGFIGLKSLDQFKTLTGSGSGTSKSFAMAPRSNSDSFTSGSFANLKLTAEKLVKEQASVKTDLDMANSKLKKSMEHIHLLEEKLQAAFNENAKLKVKQKEDEKLWLGLESKFSSTKTLSDQLTETLHFLASQVQDAEKDKQLIGEKLAANSVAIDSLNDQMKDLSIKLESAEGTVRERDHAMKELKEQKEEQEALYEDERSKTAKLVEEKDAFINSLEADLASNRLAGENLLSKLDEANRELMLKEDHLSEMKVCIKNLERDKVDLQSNNHEFAKKLATSLEEIQNLKDTINAFASEMFELDKHSMAVSDKIAQLFNVYDCFSNLVENERELTAKHAKEKYDILDHHHTHLKSEKDELQSANQGLYDKLNELQRAQESAMVQHAEECRLTEERIRKLESEAEILISKKSETEILVATLEEKLGNLSESLTSSENEKNELLLKLSELESEKNENINKLQADIQEKDVQIDGYQKEIANLTSQVQSLEQKVNEFVTDLEEKEQLIVQHKDKEKHLEAQREEIVAQLATTESKLGEAKKQYDAMLESKQLELSRHLKEISQRNDQAINDIRRKYEVEKQEIINTEKEKADKVVAEREHMFEQRIDQCKEESRQQLAHVQEEHTALIARMRKEHEKKESDLKSGHLDEVKRIQLQAENELREKTMMLRNEHETQLRALRMRHEDECRQLQQELDLQKSKEEKQKALLELQWKVMGHKPQEDPEVNSKKKDYSVSTRRATNALKRDKPTQDSPYQVEVTSPVSTLLKKVEKTNSGSMMAISKHGRKVSHREYEVETTNGGTVTKRRKSKSTVMFGEPRKHKKVATPKINTPRSVVKGVRATQPPNLGELFSEGSLNPYADGDDPYAFD